MAWRRKSGAKTGVSIRRARCLVGLSDCMGDRRIRQATVSPELGTPAEPRCPGGLGWPRRSHLLHRHGGAPTFLSCTALKSYQELALPSVTDAPLSLYLVMTTLFECRGRLCDG